MVGLSGTFVLTRASVSGVLGCYDRPEVSHHSRKVLPLISPAHLSAAASAASSWLLRCRGG